jgi:hypothetical protein
MDVLKEIRDEIFLSRIPYGKYKDWYIKDLPDHYLKWASMHIKDDDLRWRCKIEISRRKGFK